MSWQPRWRHITQLYRHPGDRPDMVEGANDCYEVCLARYLRERGYPFAGDDTALVGAMRLLATGQVDHAGQGFTSLEQGGRALDALGIGWRWTADLGVVRAAAWAILWVRPARLRTAAPNTVDGRTVYTNYPLWWLGARAQPDHFILQLPGGRFNDPLSYWNDGLDTTYTSTSLAAAFAGAFVLDGVSRAAVGTGAGGRAPRDPAALVVSCGDGLHLRQAPALTSPVLATLADGETLRDAYAGECLWTFVRARGLHGWVRREYVRRR